MYVCVCVCAVFGAPIVAISAAVGSLNGLHGLDQKYRVSTHNLHIRKNIPSKFLSVQRLANRFCCKIFADLVLYLKLFPNFLLLQILFLANV